MSTKESPLRLDVYPMLGFRKADGSSWRLQVQGRVYREVELSFGKKLLLKGLMRALRGTGESLTSELFHRRVEGFMVASEARKRLYVDIDGIEFRLKRRSRSSGIFSCKLDLPDGAIRNGLEPVASGFARLPLHIRVVGNETISQPGVAYLASPSGLSVISDIDDTIKLTNVSSRREMLAQTFLRPFEAIDGMAETYAYWQSRGVLFHYVSSSPWQIFSPIQEFLLDHRFPEGSMHLRWFRLRDEMFKRWRLLRRKGKGGMIVAMLKRMPDRRFILVGDSGERDPEIYAKIASKFGQQIRRILIRDLEESPMDIARIRRLQRRINRVPLTMFRNSSEIRELIF